MQQLYENSAKQIELTDTSFIRDQIQFLNQNERLIGLKGSRGVGKTTLLLQHAKTKLIEKKHLYVSLDDPYFQENDLLTFTDDFVKYGGTDLLLDEVHHYPNWSLTLKNIYDRYRDLKVIYTGSSLLHLTKGRGDLSRRSLTETLWGLSFREFVNISEGKNFPILSLNEIIENHEKWARQLQAEFLPIKKFHEYLDYGYYPFFLENKESYSFKLMEIMNQILEADLPQFAKINYSKVNKLKQLLYAVSESAPFKPNFERLSTRIGISINTLKDYMQYMQEAMLFNFLYSEKHGLTKVAKPEKVFLHHPNLMYAVTNSNTDIGNIRETFFFNQLATKHQVNYTEKGDFKIDKTYTFEVGGRTKKFTQIADIENSFVAMDDIEIGFRKQIPLWMFGFLY